MERCTQTRTMVTLLVPRTYTRTVAVLLAQWLWLVFCIESVAGTACSSFPCGGGGTCLPDYNNNYYCQCPADRTRYNCQQWRLPLFPELTPYAGTQTMSADHHFFNGLSNQHQGSLTAISFYTRQAGTFWLDLWRFDSGGSYTLVFSRSFTVTTAGHHDGTISPVVVLEPGVSLTVGVHSSSSLTNPLGVTLGAGYLVWRTAWVEGDFVVGTTTLTSSDNTDSAPVYMVPSIWLRATTSSGCTNQPELAVIDRPSGAIGQSVHIFLGLTTKCAGRLSSISIYAEAAGTVYIDLWKETNSGTDLVLYFTKEILVDAPGQHTVSVYAEGVYVVEGLIYGTHRSGSDVNEFVLADGKAAADDPVYDTLRYSGRHENFAWTPNVLHRSHFTVSHANVNRTPSVALYIVPNTVSQVCAAQQELDLIARTTNIGKATQIFLGLTTKCSGRLSSIGIYVGAAGTVYVDLWKETDSGTDLVLVFTMAIHTTGEGVYRVPIDDVVYVEEGWIYGSHRPQVDTNEYLLANGQTDAGQPVYNTLLYVGTQESVAWTPNVLHSSHFTSYPTNDRTPSLAIYIVPNTVSQGCAAEQELDVIDRPSYFGRSLSIFLGLTTKCAGRLSSISIYAVAAGTVYVDLWKETESGTDHILMFTHPVSTTGAGRFDVEVDVYVEEGWTYGTHRPASDVNNRVLEDGKTDPAQPAYDSIRYDIRHEDFSWTPGVLHRSHLTNRADNILRTPSLALFIIPSTEECEERRLVPPLLPGPAEPPPGLTLFPGVNTSCTAAVTGVSFYASVPGSFYVAMFNALSDPDAYSLNFMEKVSINVTGLQHVTLQNQYFLKRGDVLGIFDDPTSPNALRYVEYTDLLKAAVEYEHNMSNAHHLQLAAGDVTADSSTITVNESTRTTVHFPPLQLHLQYGTLHQASNLSNFKI